MDFINSNLNIEIFNKIINIIIMGKRKMFRFFSKLLERLFLKKKTIEEFLFYFNNKDKCIIKQYILKIKKELIYLKVFINFKLI